VIRKVFIALFAAMATGQLLGISGFADALETYGVGGGRGTWALVGAIIALEIGAIVFLLGTTRRRLGAVLTLAAMTAWTTLALQAFARGLVIPNCGCFGTFFSQELRWWVLAEDAYLLVLAAIMYRRMSPLRADERRGVGPAIEDVRNPVG
jgi:hypothetical protein